MKVKIPSFPLYDNLKKSKEIPNMPLQEMVEILNESREIEEHLEIIFALAFHHHLTMNDGELSGLQDVARQYGKDVILNLGEKADPELIRIVSLYFMENYQK